MILHTILFHATLFHATLLHAQFFMATIAKQLLFDTMKGSLGYSFMCCVGFILVGSLVELPLLFFFPRGGFLKTERFLAKSEDLCKSLKNA